MKKKLGEFFTFGDSSGLEPHSAELCPVQPEEVHHDLVVSETEANTLSTLEIHSQQSGEYGADVVPGNALSLSTVDHTRVEGNIYNLGSSEIFLAQRVIELAGEPYEKAARDVRRSILADQRGEWFEHVYPLRQPDVPKALLSELNPLIRYAKESGSFFVAAVVDGSYVVMPATLDKKAHKQGVSERYAAYANLTRLSGELATQAMVIIDPGEEEQPRYKDSEQLGLLDKDLPYGQLQYDVDTWGYVADRIEREFKRGQEVKVALAHSSGSVHLAPQANEWEYYTEPGQERSVLSVTTHGTPATSWNLGPR